MVKLILIIDILFTLIFALMLFVGVATSNIILVGVSSAFFILAWRFTIRTYKKYKNHLTQTAKSV